MIFSVAPKLNPSCLQQRKSGVLMHLSSLPGPYYIGDLGENAHEFIDFLAAAKQTFWQMLPINPIGQGNSPYSSICSLAGETLFISLDQLVKQGLLKKNDFARPSGGNKAQVNYDKAREYRQRILKKSFENFLRRKLQHSTKFIKFCHDQKEWLQAFCLFLVLSKKFKTRLWHTWPHPFNQYSARHRDMVDEESLLWHQYLQFIFYEQWFALKAYAREKSVLLIGDIPIFVAMESSEVWSNQEYFCLNPDGSPEFVAGVPPDYFNRDGQLWGNALYDWPEHRRDNFKWWVTRLKHMTNLFSAVRIDHFIGFYRYWQIPASAKTAKAGKWMLSPGDELFKAAQKNLGGLPFIAEDLGTTTPEVFALRDKYQMPGMRVMQFGFGNNEKAAYHLPHCYVENAAAYPGTHDNNTTRGWFREARKNAKKRGTPYNFDKIKNYFSTTDDKKISHSMNLDVMKSTANLTIIAMQDWLGLDEKAKMNSPGTPSGNWGWRLEKKYLNHKLAQQMADITTACHRA